MYDQSSDTRTLAEAWFLVGYTVDSTRSCASRASFRVSASLSQSLFSFGGICDVCVHCAGRLFCSRSVWSLPACLFRLFPSPPPLLCLLLFSCRAASTALSGAIVGCPMLFLQWWCCWLDGDSVDFCCCCWTYGALFLHRSCWWLLNGLVHLPWYDCIVDFVMLMLNRPMVFLNRSCYWLPNVVLRPIVWWIIRLHCWSDAVVGFPTLFLNRSCWELPDALADCPVLRGRWMDAVVKPMLFLIRCLCS